MLSLKGVNWCGKYDREIDHKLVHEICENLHPKGCANCEYTYYKIEWNQQFWDLCNERGGGVNGGVSIDTITNRLDLIIERKLTTWNPKTVSRRLQLLVHDGLIVRTAPGTYFPKIGGEK